MKKKVWKKYRRILLIIPVFLTFYMCTDDSSDDSLEGTWHVEEISQLFGTQYYDVYISVSQDDSLQIEIENFYNLGITRFVKGTLDGSEIILSGQDVDGYFITGSGTVKENKKQISFTYTVNTGNDVDHATAQYRR